MISRLPRVLLHRSRPSEAGGKPVAHFTELSTEALAACDCVYIGTPPGAHAALVVRSVEAWIALLANKYSKVENKGLEKLFCGT